MTNDWSTPPSGDEVTNAHREKVRLSTLLKVAKLEFKIMQADARAATSKSWAAVIGATPDQRSAYVEKQYEILVYENELEAVEVQLALYKHQIEMYKAWSWSNR